MPADAGARTGKRPAGLYRRIVAAGVQPGLDRHTLPRAVRRHRRVIPRPRRAGRGDGPRIAARSLFRHRCAGWADRDGRRQRRPEARHPDRRLRRHCPPHPGPHRAVGDHRGLGRGDHRQRIGRRLRYLRHQAVRSRRPCRRHHHRRGAHHAGRGRSGAGHHAVPDAVQCRRRGG